MSSTVHVGARSRPENNAYRVARGDELLQDRVVAPATIRRGLGILAEYGRDAGFGDLADRTARRTELDAAITAWTVQRPVADVVAVLQAASVPAGRIYTVADIASDPHFIARGMIEQATTPDGLALAVPGIVPKLSATPGSIRSAAPTLGQHTDDVLDALPASQARLAPTGGSPA
jgi:formyl-CoA transferase